LTHLPIVKDLQFRYESRYLSLNESNPFFWVVGQLKNPIFFPEQFDEFFPATFSRVVAPSKPRKEVSVEHPDNIVPDFFTIYRIQSLQTVTSPSIEPICDSVEES
jgi:hypothetical protein